MPLCFWKRNVILITIHSAVLIQGGIHQEKQYDAELSELHIKPEQIHHYGFAFEGKKVLIGGR